MNDNSFLFVVPWSLEHAGGVNQVVINLAKTMIRMKSYHPIILINDWNSFYPVYGELDGITTIKWRMHSLNKKSQILVKLKQNIWAIINTPILKRLVNRHKITAINFHFPEEHVLFFQTFLINSNINIPLVLSFHGGDINTITSLNNNELTLWRSLLEKVHVVACSNDLKNRIETVFGDRLNISVIHNGFDINSSELDNQATNSNIKNYILSVGKYEYRKGQDTLITAFSEINSDIDLKLIFIGAEAEALPTLLEQCVKLGVQDKVKFISDLPHNEVLNYFKNATLFVLPSRDESFGIVLLEAAAFALPVIASRVGGIPEIITHDKTGLLFDVDDVQALSSCIKKQINNPATSREMGLNLKVFAEKNFTWVNAHNKYIKMISSL